MYKSNYGSLFNKADSKMVVSCVEAYKNILYFAIMKGTHRPVSPFKTIRYLRCLHQTKYESFFSDYGPFHIGHIKIFVDEIHGICRLYKTKKLVCWVSDDKIQRLNAAYLMGCYLIIYRNMLPLETYRLLTSSDWDLLTYRDASSGVPMFEITLLDVFEGLYKALVGGFFYIDDFNYRDYFHYEKVRYGDLNWIIPGKMLAFSGPHSQSKTVDDYPLHAPDYYHEYFKKNNVTAVIRLNQQSYNAKQFTDFGFEHHELFFYDGSVPSYAIVDKFNKLCETTKGAIAVHCKAGLGRTGTLIGCYLMKHHAFTALQAISWLRICRPGSVIGYQQKFLIEIQSKMLSEGALFRIKCGITEIPKFGLGIYGIYNLESEVSYNDTILYASDDSENVPTVQPATCKITKDVKIAPDKNNKEEFVSLDSIIKTNEIEVDKRSMAIHRAHRAFVRAKDTYTANKNNYIMSNTGGNVESSSVSKTHIVTNNKTPTFASKKGSVNSPMKVAFTKTQYMAKGGIYNQRANLARIFGVYSAGPIKSYSKNIPGAAKTSLIPDTLKKSNSSPISNKSIDMDNSPSNTLKNSAVFSTDSSIKLANDTSNKKMILRKKTLKSAQMEQIQDFKNCNISNSDSERDSTNTTLTNISADSLENIPRKMATRSDKSKSLEPDPNVVNGNGNMEEGINSQGTRLCQIKANRKKTVGFENSIFKKDGVKTRNQTSLMLAKKK